MGLRWLTRISIAAVVAVALLAGAIVGPKVALAASSQPEDCTANSIIWCGASSKADWLSKVSSGDGHNTGANIQNIYYDQGRGITAANFNASTTVVGTVFKNGNVEVNGKVVATGAKSVGRDFIAGSVKSGTVWMRPTSVSFVANSIQAWVDMSGGTFHYFILQSCGNPGVATPVKAPTPSPTPKPTSTQTPTPTVMPTPTPTPPPVTPGVVTCQQLTATQPDQSGAPTTFNFTVIPSVPDSATITGYQFSFTNGNVPATTSSPTLTLNLDSGETLTVQGQVLTTAGPSPISDACSATVTAPQNGQVLGTTTTPTTPVATPTTPALPATGAASALAGAGGLTAMGMAGRSYIRSRKSFMNNLRQRGRRK
jgi:hypothetical protein